MRFIPRSRLALIGLSGVLAVGLLGMAGVALAEDAPVPGIEQIRKARAAKFRLARIGVHHLVQASGLDPALVREAFKGGSSLQEIFDANGVDSEAVVDEVLAGLDERLADAVAAGRLSQEKADALHARAETAIPRLLEVTRKDLRGVRFVRHELRIAAGAIGITPSELVAALREGQTVAQVAEANGVDPGDVIDAMVAPINERIEVAVAAGKLESEKGETMKARALERITAFVNEGAKRPAATAGG